MQSKSVKRELKESFYMVHTLSLHANLSTKKLENSDH